MPQRPHFVTRDLRLAFDDAVISLPLAASATLADVAQLWEDVVVAHQGNPVDIKITFTAASRRPDARTAE